ncbi:Protein FAR1-RELATED SEQUENCE like [Actinidia chinensis var. chinensis]|uniref:Protein FAR1-RELATED SEQUENCE like n=1 Tax=Actinidia chinensis var. chinensis TaxID=1590841 RepID=A0A2R6R5G6_ACTCC|nr:Protein FAR1-RELATED SEQUENCE like [Actinidia chinensis var. chinensis]
MFFEIIEEARKYYEDYGRQNDFWIRSRTSSKGQNRSNDVTSVLFVCAKEGKYIPKTEKDGVEGNDERVKDDKVLPKKRKRSCSTAKFGYNAHLRIKRDKWSLKWLTKDICYLMSKKIR